MDAALSSPNHHRDPMVGGPGPEGGQGSTPWAVGQSLLLHAVVLALLIAGLSQSPDAPAPGAPGTINVDLIAPSSLSAAMQHTLSPPIEQPATVLDAPPPEPTLPEPLAEPETPTKPIAPETVVPQAQTAGGETGSTGAGEAVQANQDLSAQAFSDRRLRVLAIRRANRASQSFPVARTAGATRHRQPSGVSRPAQPALPTLPVGISLDPAWRSGLAIDADAESLLLAYEEQLQASILLNWVVPDDLPLDQPCRVTIEQTPQGEVLRITVDELCPFQEAASASIHDALMVSQPLPHQGFEELRIETLPLVFQRHAH